MDQALNFGTRLTNQTSDSGQGEIVRHGRES
jgi:hypothetical protein